MLVWEDLLMSVELLLLQDLQGLNTIALWLLALVCSPQDTGRASAHHFWNLIVNALWDRNVGTMSNPKKIKANYGIWCLKPSKVQQNPFGVTCVYNLYFLKKTANPRRWQRRQCRAHSTWNVLAASQCVLLNSPHPAQGHTKSFCLQRKTKVNYEGNGMGIY